MNILIASALDIDEPDKGLSGSPQTKTIEYYLSKGDSVAFITSNLLKKNYRKVFNHENLIINRFDFLVLKKITSIRKIGYLAQLIYWILFQVKIFSIVRQLGGANFDIFYAYEVEAVPIMWLLSKIYSKPLVTRFQGTIISKNITLYGKLKYWQHILALAVKSDLTIMTNDGTQGDIVLKKLRGNQDRVLFLINGLDPKFLQIPIKPEEKEYSCINIYSCGRLVDWKNHDRNIRIIAEVVKKNIEIILFIIGGGPKLNDLKKLAVNLGISNNVYFTGPVEHSELIKYIEKSDLYLTNYNYSNFGKTLMEAMGGGKAIIASNVGDTELFVKHGKHGYLFADNDINGMVNKIIYLIQNPKEIRELGMNARSYAANNFWSWEDRFAFERIHLIKLNNKIK
jgi:glycosyltransferase involved in cell wall biosynthesis